MVRKIDMAVRFDILFLLALGVHTRPSSSGGELIVLEAENFTVREPRFPALPQIRLPAAFRFHVNVDI